MATMPPVRVELIAEVKEFVARMKEGEKAITEIGKAGDSTSAKLGALGQKVSSGILVGAGGAMILATKYAYEYQKSIEEIGLQSNASEAEVQRLRKAVLATSDATATSTTQIAEAYKAVEKAGISGAAADTLVKNAAMAANVAHADLNSTIQAGLIAQQLHIKGSEDSAKMMNSFTQAMKGGNVALNDITDALQGKAAVALQSYGVDLNSTLAAMDVFAKAGIKGAAAGSTLAMSLNKLLTPSKKTDDILKSVGLTQDKLAADIRKPGGLMTVFGELSDAAKKSGVGAQDMGRFYSQIFGGKSGAGATLLLNNLASLQKAGANISGGNLKDSFATWLQNPEGALAKFQTTAKNTLINLGDVLLPVAGHILNWVNDFAGVLKKSPVWRGAFEGAMLAAVGTAFAVKVKKAFDFVKDLFKGSAQAANTAALDANTAALDTLSGALATNDAALATNDVALETSGHGGTPSLPKPKSIVQTVKDVLPKVAGVVKTVAQAGSTAEVVTTVGATAALAAGAVAFTALLSAVQKNTWAHAADIKKPWGSAGMMPNLAGQVLMPADKAGDVAYISTAQQNQLIAAGNAAKASGKPLTQDQIFQLVQAYAIQDMPNIPAYRTQVAQNAANPGTTKTVVVKVK